MKVLDSAKSADINETVKESISEKSIVLRNKATTYFDISKYVVTHLTEKSGKETTVSTLKWAHIAIASAKRNFLGIYHKIKGKYLQNYLNNLCTNLIGDILNLTSLID